MGLRSKCYSNEVVVTFLGRSTPRKPKQRKGSDVAREQVALAAFNVQHTALQTLSASSVVAVLACV